MTKKTRHLLMFMLAVAFSSFLSLHAQVITRCSGDAMYAFEVSDNPISAVTIEIEGDNSEYDYTYYYDSGFYFVSVHWNDVGGNYKVKYHEHVIIFGDFNEQEYDVTIIPSNLYVNYVVTDEVKVFKATNSIHFQPGFHYTAITSASDLKGIITDCEGNQVTSLSQLKSVIANEDHKAKVSPQTPEISQKNDDVIVYPNPTDGITHIVFPNSSENYDVSIFNISGLKLNQKTMQGETQDIDLSSYPKGMYFMRITDRNGKQYIKKIQRE